MKLLTYLFAPVFEGLFHYGHELVGDGAVDDAVVVAQSEVNDGTDGDGIVSVLVGQDEWLLGDSSDAQDGGVGLVNDGQAKHGAELTGIGNGEGCAFNIRWHQVLGTGALAEIGDAALQSEEVELIGAFENGHDESPVERDAADRATLL